MKYTFINIIMTVLVEHQKRRQEILEKALEVFCEEGYNNTTFQKIADKSGITRTSLYIYFSSKQEIFLMSIKQLLIKIGQEITLIMCNDALNSAETLKEMIFHVLNSCLKYKSLLNIIIPYLMKGNNFEKSLKAKIKYCINKLRHFMSNIIIQGIKDNELKSINIKCVNEILYSLIKAAIVDIAIMDKSSIENINKTIDYTIDGLRCTNEQK